MMSKKTIRMHTMDDSMSALVKSMGMDEMYNKLRQLDEASALVEQGKLKPEVYEALMKDVKESLSQEMKGQQKKKDWMDSFRNMFHQQEVEVPNFVRGYQEKPLIASYLYQRSRRDHKLIGKNWKRRYVMLYERSISICRKKGEEDLPRHTIILTPEFFCAQVGKQGSDSTVGDFGVDDTESQSFNEEGRRHRGDPEHQFFISDLNMKYTLGADTQEEVTMWVHTITNVIRKILDEESYFDTPTLLDAPVRTPERIQADYESRKNAYVQSSRQKTLKRVRKSMFGKKKEIDEALFDEDQWEEEGGRLAAKDAARRLIEQEREHVRRLLEEQEQNELELERIKEEANTWKHNAENNEKKLKQAEFRAEEAERKEQELLETLRAQNLEKEDALKAEHDVAKNQLATLHDARRKSHHPAALEEYEKQIKALQTKLKALESALDVDFDGLDWDGTLDDAEAKMKMCIPRLMSDDIKESQAAQSEFDQWDKLIRNHADYVKREEEKWKIWEEEEKPKCEEACAEMKKMVPREVLSGVSETFLKNKGLSPNAAKRVMGTKILQFLYLEKDVIAKLHIADLSSRYVPQGLDITELRAVYSRLPDEFLLDGDGRKKLWLETTRQKLKMMSEKEKTGGLTGPEKKHPAYKSAAEIKASAPAPRAKPKPGGPKKGGKKLDSSALNALFSGGPRGPPTSGASKGFPGAGGPPPHILKMMEKAQQEEKKEESRSSRPKAAKNGSNTKTDVKADETKTTNPSNSATRKSKVRSVRNGTSNFFSSVKSMITGSTIEESVPAQVNSEMKEVQAKKAKQEMNAEQKLLADNIRGMMDSAKSKDVVKLDDFDEKNAPAFDFGEYGSRKNELSKRRAANFNKGVEEGIDSLIKVIKRVGKFDKSEGGVATVTFGELFEEYENISDMLVGLLMRAKKRKRLKYSGDMLFQGIHDHVKITVLHTS